MSWIDGLRHRLRAVIRPAAYEREMQEEMRFHLDLDAMNERDADLARRRFGNRTYWQEETRRMSWLGTLDGLTQDARYAWRSLARSPGLAIMIVLTITLGVGVNAATFTVLDRLYLRAPSGVVDPGTLRRIWFISSGERMVDGKPHAHMSANYPMYRAVRAASGDPERLGLYVTDFALRFGADDKRTRVRGVFATASYFSLLGVRPVLGRTYTTDEDSLGHGSRVVVVGHRFWRESLGSDSTVLGRQIRIETDNYTVIGVLPPDFNGLDLQQADVWIPLAAIPSRHWIVQSAGRGPWTGANPWAFQVLQRVSSTPDPGFEQRASQAVRDANRLAFPKAPDTLMTVVSAPLVGTGPGEPGQNMIISTRLSGVALIVLLIACANVINLLLARAEQRRREIAVRLAVGISRARLVRLLTVETLLLALVAGLAGVLAAWWGGSVLRALLLPEVQWYESALDSRVIGFALAMALVTGLIAGFIPAWQASRPDLARALKDGTRDGSVHRSRLRNGLAIAQAALSVLLLVGAALFVRSLKNVQGLDIGYDAKQLLFASVRFDNDSMVPRAVVNATLLDMQRRLAERQGVEAVARAFDEPMQAISFVTFYWGESSSSSLRHNFPTHMPVSSGFFDAVGMRMLRGSTFDDRPGGPGQLVVNEAMAKLLWPGRDPIGECVRFEKRERPCYTVVGVVENARQSYVIEPDAKPQFYLPLDNLPMKGYNEWTLVIRARIQAMSTVTSAVLGDLRRAFPRGEARVESMTSGLEPQYRPWRLGATLFTAFGLLALVVALVGIYSTVSYGVSQRTHEFGVRVALGARMGNVLRLVVGEGLRVVAIGVVIGVALALASGRLIAALLYGVTPGEPIVILAVTATIFAVAAIATLIPAWRAARVDPVTALRAE